MKLKLDENLGPSIASIFRDAGHDVFLVREQGLCGKEDSVLIEVCRAEGRCLVTLGLSRREEFENTGPTTIKT